MRIIAGEFRSRRLASPPESLPTRPITDRVKEAVFNLLRGHFEDQAILDCFAGSGSIGLEALSRGASHCLFVEQSRVCAKTLSANIETLGVKDRCDIVIGDALSPTLLARIRQQPHVIFFDPPYALAEDEEQWPRLFEQMIRLAEHMDPEGFLVLRTAWPLEGVALEQAQLIGPETHDYNTMAVHLYQPKALPGEEPLDGD